MLKLFPATVTNDGVETLMLAFLISLLKSTGDADCRAAVFMNSSVGRCLP